MTTAHSPRNVRENDRDDVDAEASTDAGTEVQKLMRGNRPLAIMLLAFVILALVGLAATWAYMSRAQPTTESQSAAAPPDEDTRPNGGEMVQTTSMLSDFEQKVVNGEYRSVRLIGDSITAGYGTDDYEDPDFTGETLVIYDDGAGDVHYETTAEAKCWANDFRAWAEARGMASFVNAGISGWFMRDLASNPYAWIHEGADVIFVALGTNDAGYYGLEEFEQASRSALEEVEKSCKLVVVLAPVKDLRPESMLVVPPSAYGDVLQSICEERGYVFVDPREEVTPDLFVEDGLHPNTEGSHAIWECVRQTLGLS